MIVSGTILDEPYLGSMTGCSTVCSWTVPETAVDISISQETYRPRPGPTPPSEDEACEAKGCYFVLGDNRQNSSDSRQGWLVPAENIVGFIDVD
ncbi:MAG: S26 family signal peptidase [Acidimicrobiia bacterium]